MHNEKQRHCPNCGKKFTLSDENIDFRPFCCRRCKMADLGKWLQEKYVVEGEVLNDDPASEDNDDGENTNE